MAWDYITNDKNDNCGMCDDEGWDLALEFLTKFHMLYYKKFGRIANECEISQAVSFVNETAIFSMNSKSSIQGD